MDMVSHFFLSGTEISTYSSTGSRTKRSKVPCWEGRAE